MKIFQHFLWQYSKEYSGERGADMYLPKYSVSDKMKELKVATIIMHRGLNVVTKTGPLVFIITP